MSGPLLLVSSGRVSGIRHSSQLPTTTAYPAINQKFADQPALAVSQPPSRGASAGMKQMAPFR